MNLKDFHPNIKYRLFDSFLSSTVYNMMLPFLAIYFAQEFGVANAGVLLAIYFSSGIISSVLGGHLSDQHGRRKVLIFTGITRVVSLGAITICNSSFYHSPEITFIMFLIINAAAGISMPTNQALLLDVSTAKQRQEIFGIEYWSLNSALFIGSVLGGLFFEEYKFYIFLLCFSISILSLLIVIFYIKENNKKLTIELKTFKNPFKIIINNLILVSKNQGFIMILFASFLILSVETQAKNYIGVSLSTISEKSFLTEELTFSGTQMYGFLRAENALLIMIFSLLINRWIKSFNPLKILIIGIVFNVIGYIVLTISTDYLILVISMLIATIGEILYWPIKKAYLASFIPENNKGAFLSISGLVGRGAAVTGSLSLIIGAYFNSYYIALMLLFFGATGLFIYLKTFKNKKMNISGV